MRENKQPIYLEVDGTNVSRDTIDSVVVVVVVIYIRETSRRVWRRAKLRSVLFELKGLFINEGAKNHKG